MRKISFQLLCIGLIVAFFSNVSLANELLPQDIATELGVSVGVGELFVRIYKYQLTAQDMQKEEVEYKRMITSVDYAYIGNNQHLWRLQYPEGFWTTGASLSIHINADNDRTTGREGNGTDLSIMPTWRVDGTDGTWTRGYSKDGDRVIVPLPMVVVDDNVVYVKYEFEANSEGGQLVFENYINSTILTPKVKDVTYTGWLEIIVPEEPDLPATLEWTCLIMM